MLFSVSLRLSESCIHLGITNDENFRTSYQDWSGYCTVNFCMLAGIWIFRRRKCYSNTCGNSLMITGKVCKKTCFRTLPFQMVSKSNNAGRLWRLDEIGWNDIRGQTIHIFPLPWLRPWRFNGGGADIGSMTYWRKSTANPKIWNGCSPHIGKNDHTYSTVIRRYSFGFSAP